MEPLLGCATAYGRFSFRIKSRCRHPASSIPILSMEISSLYVFRLSSNHVSRQYYRHQPQYMLPGLRQDESTHCVPATEIQGHVEMAEGTNWRDSYRRIGFPTLSNDWCILRSRQWVLSLIACLPQGDDPSVSSWHQYFLAVFVSSLHRMPEAGRYTDAAGDLEERMFPNMKGPISITSGL